MYTVEVYKKDRRTTDGYRSITTLELDCSSWKEFYERAGLGWSDEKEIGFIAEKAEKFYPQKKGYIWKINKTMVERKNFMTGETFMERYDTPRFCSPSSESYWSM